jgi:hypothetical protein
MEASNLPIPVDEAEEAVSLRAPASQLIGYWTDERTAPKGVQEVNTTTPKVLGPCDDNVGFLGIISPAGFEQYFSNWSRSVDPGLPLHKP